MNEPEILGLAALGKTAAALALVIALIVLCSVLLRRLGPGRGHRGGTLRVVSGTAVGSRERVVVVEVQDTWLVLGVASGQVSKLHSMPAPDDPDGGARTDSTASREGRKSGESGNNAQNTEGFAARFARALRHHTGARPS